MKFKKGDRVVSVKLKKPFQTGIWCRDAMFDGVKTIDEVKSKFCRIEDLWYTPEMLKLESEAKEFDFMKIRYCERCGHPFMVALAGDEYILRRDENGNPKPPIKAPPTTHYVCMKCGHYEFPHEDAMAICRETQKAQEEESK